MDIPERRLVGALLLLLGVSFLAIAVGTGQLEIVRRLLTTGFP
jgi:hypothetical protein